MMLKALWPKIMPPLAVFCLVAIIGGSWTVTRPKQYQATARVWIQTKGVAVEVAASENGNSGGGQFLTSPLTNGNNPLTTACEVIRSEAVVNEAHNILTKKMPKDSVVPEASEIMSGMKTEVVKDADIVKISYAGHYPQRCLAIVEAVVDAFFQENNIQTAGNATQSKYYLQKQLQQAREQYQQTRKRLKDFQESTHAVNLKEESSGLMKQRDDVAQAIITAKQTISVEHGRLKYIEGQIGFGPIRSWLSTR